MAGQYCLTTMQGAMILSRFVQPIPGHAIAGLLTTGNYRPPFMSALRFGLRRAMLATTAGAFYQYAMAWRERNQRQMSAALSGLRSVRGQMPTVEIRLTPADVAARLDEVRRWLDVRGIRSAKFTSTGSSNETVVLVEFNSSSDAEEFAREFSGTIVAN